jgi:hypothetical protein
MCPSRLYSAEAPRPIHVGQQMARDASRSRIWRVIHACEYARDVLPIVEAELSVGMRPYIVTPHGGGTAEAYLSGRRHDQPRSLSLLRSWQDVRNWRKSILERALETSTDLVHGHSFAAGMAAVRSTGGVVYELGACIEELAISAGQCEPGSWMGRSFRVAEQFVVTRAAAVIVHSSSMLEAAMERGALPENIFLIPEPAQLDDQPILATATGKQLASDENAVYFFVPRFAAATTAELDSDQTALLEGFALAARENSNFHLMIEIADEVTTRASIDDRLAQLEIATRVHCIEGAKASSAWQHSHAVVVTGSSPSDPVAARRENESCLTALVKAKALLAADVSRNRETCPEGRGCLWFERNNPGDLARRLTFLGRKPDFRKALGLAGRTFLWETRNGPVIGKKYHEAYQHAFNRRKSTGPGTGVASLEPAANWS